MLVLISVEKQIISIYFAEYTLYLRCIVDSSIISSNHMFYRLLLPSFFIENKTPQ